VSEDAGAPAARYTLALSKGGALLAETRILLNAWQPGESSVDLGARVLRDDLLGRATARRALDIVRAFTLRFLQPSDVPARHLRRLLSPTAPRQMFSDLVLFYIARQDDLLRDFVIHGYWPAARDGALTIRNEDVHCLIAEAHRDGRIRSPWSPELRRDLAGRLLVVLTTFGLMEEDRRGRRHLLPYTPADGTILYLAYLLHDQGVSDGSLAEHPDWVLFGLEPPDVWNRLEALVSAGWLIVQRAGQVVRVNWTHKSVEEMLDVLAGR